MRNLFRALGAVLLAAALSASAADTPNYQGLWWASPPESESGWGLNVAHQGDVAFATWFTYNAAGQSWWLVTVANKTAEGTFAGDIYETSGPALTDVPFDPKKVMRTPVGRATLTFRDLDNGTLRYTLKGVSQVKYITREVFGPLPTCTYAAQPDLAGATNYTDLWWVPAGAESGWGINLTHQGDTIFATWFTYGSDGTPLWFAATASHVSNGIYSGPLVRTAGPPFSAQPFDPSKVKRTESGMIGFSFSSGNAATMSFTVNGTTQTKPITRQVFFPPAGTRCGEPTRTIAPFSVVAAGDIAQCTGFPASASAAARTAKLVNSSDALVLVLGDNAYENGTPDEFASCFDPTWGVFGDRLRPTPGNHDYYTTDAKGYYDYFGARAGPDRRGYYSFDYGGWHFVSLNSLVDLQPGSAQYQWLADDLAKSADTFCTIAMVHYPRFNSGSTHGSTEAMRPAFDLLQRSGAEIVLSGHEHLYERFAPQRADGTADPARGLRQFTVGTGGGTPMMFGTTLPNSEFRFSGSWGILRLTLSAGRYAWQFWTVDHSSPIDTGTGTCHP
ncbi:MAG: metallophosphoesterase family protein [Betaproteobacteria bacterium]